MSTVTTPVTITGSTQLHAWIACIGTADHSDEEHAIEDLVVRVRYISSTQVELRLRHGRGDLMTGAWNVYYSVL